jgi:hypothetical protein
MRPVDQTEFGLELGNCLMACVASICEVSLASLPVLTWKHDDGSWWEVLSEALLTHGHSPRFVTNVPMIAPPGYHIARGISPRGLSHAVVALDGEIVHDPHPSREGIASIEHWVLLMPLASKRTVLQTEEADE